MNDFKSQLSGLLSKPATKVAAPESPKEPILVTPEPTRQELDHLVSTPAVPTCAGCGNAQTKHGSGWRCDFCYERALKQMTGVSAPKPEAAASEPALAPIEVTVFKEARLRVYMDLLRAQESVNALLKLAYGDDLLGHAVKSRVELALLEARIANPELGDIDLKNLPDEYRLVGKDRTARMQGEAQTGYESPDAVSHWGAR